MSEISDVKPCGWPVERGGEVGARGKPSVGKGTALWDPEGRATMIPLDLCQEHLKEHDEGAKQEQRD